MMQDLSQYRAEFPITEQYAFLSHAAISPSNRRMSKTLADLTTMALHKPPALMLPQIFGTFIDLKQRLATLVNAQTPDEIVLVPNTAFGINTAAASLPLRRGDNVLVLDGDYPANIYPWQQLAYKGVLTKVVPQRNGGLDLDLLAARIDKRTRVIALSTVMFATGFRNDMEAVGRLCQEHGIYFVVDAIQSAGALPIDVQAWNVSMLTAGSQKWLLGTPGSGFLYCRNELIDELQPGAYVGAASVVDAQNYLDYNLTQPASADRFMLGTPNILGSMALHASLSLLQEVGIEQVSRQVLALSSALIDDLSERGFTLAAATAPEQRSGIVVAQVPDGATVCQGLEERGIIATPRGAGVRLAPHFYNTQDEILRVGEALEQLRG